LALSTGLLVVLALAFAWSIGAHYTGACMGMAYGSGSIGLKPALVLMGVLALAGAALASHRVEVTVGLHLIASRQVTTVTALLIIAVAFTLTTLYTAFRVPTSTIQILVFSVAGVALEAGIAVHWATVLRLAGLWVVAPPAAGFLGFVLTRVLDRVIRTPVPAPVAGRPRNTLGPWPNLLVAVGAAASFTMGANDVSNATGALVMTRVFNVWTAGFLGGVGLLIGVVTWGRPLLQTVAFDLVHVDLPMATAAQLVQAVVVLAAVSAGLFTSMNQALVGAMMGAGLARGAERVRWTTVRNIVTGWMVGPPSGMLLGGLLAHAARMVHLIH